jgi:hypothetical protein
MSVYCGHIIDRDELHKTPDKIQAITNAPKPENVTQLKSFLGLVNYYGKIVILLPILQKYPRF